MYIVICGISKYGADSKLQLYIDGIQLPIVTCTSFLVFCIDENSKLQGKNYPKESERYIFSRCAMNSISYLYLDLFL